MKKSRYTFTLSEHTIQLLRQLSADTGKSMSAIIEEKVKATNQLDIEQIIEALMELIRK